MKLSKSNLFARYYNWIYETLPNDICSLFWGSVFAIGLSVFIVPGQLVTPSNKGVGTKLGNGILLWLAYLFLVMVGNGIISKFGYQFVGFWGIFGLAALFGALIIGLSIGIPVAFVIGGIVTHEKVTETQAYDSIKERTSDFVGAIRQKHCTKINWK